MAFQKRDPQLILTGKLEPNAVGGEVIKFSINLGFFQLNVIVNVPDQDATEAPVYVRFRTWTKKFEPEAIVARQQKHDSESEYVKLCDMTDVDDESQEGN